MTDSYKNYATTPKIHLSKSEKAAFRKRKQFIDWHEARAEAERVEWEKARKLAEYLRLKGEEE